MPELTSTSVSSLFNAPRGNHRVTFTLSYLYAINASEVSDLRRYVHVLKYNGYFFIHFISTSVCLGHCIILSCSIGWKSSVQTTAHISLHQIGSFVYVLDETSLSYQLHMLPTRNKADCKAHLVVYRSRCAPRCSSYTNQPRVCLST